MSLHYKINDQSFSFSYTQCKEHCDRINALSDADFLNRLPEALHLAIFICYIKEYTAEYLLSDDGLIHELAHLMHIPHATDNLREIRDKYRTLITLSY